MFSFTSYLSSLLFLSKEILLTVLIKPIIYTSKYCIFSGFSILSGVEILFYVAKFFFSLSKSAAEVKQGRRNTEMTCAEVDDTLQIEELDVN